MDQARGLFFETQKWRYALSSKRMLNIHIHCFYVFSLYIYTCIVCSITCNFARCKPDVETYNALINVHGRAGQWRWAMNIMEDMLRAAVCILFSIP